MDNHEEECCPKIDVEKWDRKTFEWKNKPFIKETIPAFFHIPLPGMIGKKIRKMYELVENAGASIPDVHDALILFRDPTAFKSEIYYAVTKSVDGANNNDISGTFEARVFDGPYQAAPRFISEMEIYLKEKNLQAKDYYMHYAYCPKCAKKFGHNYMILFALV